MAWKRSGSRSYIDDGSAQGATEPVTRPMAPKRGRIDDRCVTFRFAMQSVITDFLAKGGSDENVARTWSPRSETELFDVYRDCLARG